MIVAAVKKFWAWYKPIHDSFHDSEVILWSRLQVLGGAAWFAASTADLTPLVSNPKYVSAWVLFNGVVTEYLRRRNAEFNDPK